MSDNLSLKAEFEGFSEKEYLTWFKQNRHKKMILPIYKTADDNTVNRLKDVFVHTRQRIIEMLVQLNLKSLKRK